MEITYMDENYNDKTINLETAKLEELDAAYTFLLERSDDGGAFPGSKGWEKANKFFKTLSSLEAARPDVMAFRKERIAKSTTPFNPWTN